MSLWLAVLGGVLGTLAWLVLLLAGMPNQPPPKLAVMRRWTYAAAIAGIACAGCAVWLHGKGCHGLAALVGSAPLIALVLAMLWLSVRSV